MIRINENNDLSQHDQYLPSVMAMYIANDSHSPFDPIGLFEFEGWLYEDLRQYPMDPDNDAQFRVVLDVDDYDYVEDPETIRQLIARRDGK